KATRMNNRIQPALQEIPVVITKISDGVELLAGRNRSFIVNNATSSSRITLHLCCSGLLRLRNQPMHVDINRRLEETSLAAIVVFNGRMTGVFIDHVGKLRIP